MQTTIYVQRNPRRTHTHDAYDPRDPRGHRRERRMHRQARQLTPSEWTDVARTAMTSPASLADIIAGVWES